MKHYIDSRPDVERLSIDELLIEAQALITLGIRAVALFPVIRLIQDVYLLVRVQRVVPSLLY
jgi:delta-aminolevulinic acid dehydratase/porphobilinogen synthase